MTQVGGYVSTFDFKQLNLDLKQVCQVVWVMSFNIYRLFCVGICLLKTLRNVIKISHQFLICET
jgi:hypothetical protein